MQEKIMMSNLPEKLHRTFLKGALQFGNYEPGSDNSEFEKYDIFFNV